MELISLFLLVFLLIVPKSAFISHIPHIFFHPGGAVFLHALRNVTIYVKGKGCCSVPKVALYCLHKANLALSKFQGALIKNFVFSFLVRRKKPKNLCTEQLRSKVFLATFSHELLLCVIF